MPRDGLGVASPPASSAAVSGTTISSTKYNALVTDVYAILNTEWPLSLSPSLAALGGQASNANLTSLSTLGTAADKIAYTTGVGTWAETPFPSWARLFNASADQATARTSFLGANLVSMISLPIVAGDILYASGTNTLTRLAKGNDGQVLKLASGVPSWANKGEWTYGALWVTTSGTSFVESSIPSTATQIEMLLSGVSTTAGDELIIRIGPSSGLESSGYVSISALVASGAAGVTSGTSGFSIASGSAGAFTSGKITIDLMSSGIWVSSHAGFRDTSNAMHGGGYKSITGDIGQVQLTLAGGAFDGGSAIVRWR